jgi:hypothetical protein
MLRKAFAISGFIVVVATPAFAQLHAEAFGTIGYTFSDGVSFSPTVAPINGLTYARTDPKDSVSFAFGAGVFLNKNAELEFVWNHQPTKLDVSGGTGPTLEGDMNVDNYHGNFVYNMGEMDAKLRPFFYVGIGATRYGDATFSTVTINGITKFSWAIGAGVKSYPSKHAGIRASVRWVPTYIKTDAAGWWCDPYWGCAPLGNAQYSNQFELSGGVTFRFEPEPEPLPEGR